MTIQDHKITAWLHPVTAEADRPLRSADEMKAIFDSNSNQLKEALNGLIDQLSGAQGAEGIGASIEGLSGNTIAELLEALAALLGQKPSRSEVLTRENTDSYTPTAATHPATKGYVDSIAVGEGKMVSVNGKTGVSITLTPEDLGAAHAARTLRCTLSAQGWSSEAPYTQTISLPALTAEDLGHLFASAELSSSSTAGLVQQESWNAVSRIEAQSGSITAVCWNELPQTDLPLRLEIFS